jgi:type III secretory pathway component EscV
MLEEDSNMCHGKHRSMYLVAVVGLVIALAFNVNALFLVVLAICPLMMIFMMRSMNNVGTREDHSAGDCQHDRSHRDHPAAPR